MASGTRDLQFSVSATNRSPRPGEAHGINYYFLTDDEFKARIDNGDFVEYEEVYPGRFYGTLRSEIDNRLKAGHNVILDIDVKGGVNVKRQFTDNAVNIFIMPPSIAELRNRLESRGTDTAEVIDQRVARAEYELSFASQYDYCVTNDVLDEAVMATTSIIDNFIDCK